MINLNPRIGIPLFLVALVVMLASFTPTVPAIEAASCSSWSYDSAFQSGTWDQCAWEFGCFINPFKNDSKKQSCTRSCAHKYNSQGEYCGMDCWDNCSWSGGCC